MSKTSSWENSGTFYIFYPFLHRCGGCYRGSRRQKDRLPPLSADPLGFQQLTFGADLRELRNRELNNGRRGWEDADESKARRKRQLKW
jgi:hypothetical protein